MTLRYSHLSQVHKKDAVKALEKVVYQNFIKVKIDRVLKTLEKFNGAEGSRTTDLLNAI